MALTTQQIQNAYVAFFNRPADNEGLRYWGSYAGSSADLLNTFAQSAEYKSLYSGMNNTQLVNAVYQNLFGHAPDVKGLEYWVDNLSTGKLSIGNIADAINKGAQSTDATIIANKVAAATAFTAALDTTAEEVAYAGVNSTGLAAVKAWLAAVSSDATTIPNTDSVNSIVKTVQSNVVSTGKVFTLTGTVDNIIGTSGNDSIVGDNNTSSAGDQIDGGDGVDTLKLYGNATKPAFVGVEKVYLNGNTAGFDVSTDSAVTNLDLEAVATSQTYTIANGQAVSIANEAAGRTIDFAGDTVTALKVGLNGNGTAAGTNDVTIDFNSTAQTSVAFTTSTKKSFIELTNTGAKLETVTIAGDQALSLESALTTVKTIDASTATGDVTIVGVGASTLTFTGGSGNDKIALAATLTAADTITGGAGTDTLSISDADTIDSAAEVANVTGFEIFEAAATDSTTYDLSFLNAKNSLTGLVISGTGTTTTVSNLNAASVSNITITADGTASISATDFVSGGTSDTATVTLKADASITNGVDGALTFSNVDVLNLVSKSDGTPTKTVGGTEEHSIKLTATDLEKVVVTGDEAVVVETVAGTLPTEIDASGMSGAAVTIDTNASAIVSLLVKGSAKNDTIDIDNTATTTSTLYLGGGNDTVTVDGASSSAHTLKFTAEALNSGDIKAGNVSTVTLTGAAAGAVITLDFLSAFEGLLKSGGVVLGSSASDITIAGTSLGATSNIAAAQASGNMVIQIDLNGDGAYVASDDYQITLVGTGNNDTLVYKASADIFTFTVV